MSYILNKEDKDFLLSIQNQLETAYKHKYIRNMDVPTKKKLIALWERMIDKKYIGNIHCGSCIMELCLNVAKWLKNNYKDGWELEPSKEIIENEIVTKENGKEVTSSKKRGRKKTSI